MAPVYVSDAFHVTRATTVMCAQGMLVNPFMLDGVRADSSCAARAAFEYLDSVEEWGVPSALYIRKHLRWIFRAELQPTQKYPPKEAYMGSNGWRPRLWNFLVRPYLTSLYQFRQVVHFFCLKAGVEVPVDISSLPLPTFKSIRTHSHEK